MRPSTLTTTHQTLSPRLRMWRLAIELLHSVGKHGGLVADLILVAALGAAVFRPMKLLALGRVAPRDAAAPRRRLGRAPPSRLVPGDMTRVAGS